MEVFDPHVIDLKRKEFDFANEVFKLFPEGEFFWMKRPEYHEFREKVEGRFEPDMQFESEDGKCFWIDTVYRESYDSNGGINVYPEDDYLQRMKDYDELEDPIFVAIGIDGPTDAPYDFLFGHMFEFAFHTITASKCRELETSFKLRSIRERLIL